MTIRTVEQLIAAYNAGIRQCSDVELPSADLSYAHLSDIDLRYAYLENANLSYTRLDGANLTGAHLSGVNLTGANLACANLNAADLRGSRLTDCEFFRANLQGVNWAGVQDPSASSHDFISAVLLQAAGNDVRRRMISGLVLVSRNWCWADMEVWLLPELRESERQWIVGTLTGRNGWPDVFTGPLRHFRFFQPIDKEPTHAD